MAFIMGGTVVINNSRQLVSITSVTISGQHNNTFAAGSGTWAHLVLPNQDRGTIYQHSSGSGIPLFFQVDSGGTTSGSVVASGGTASYNTSSDYRMKENVVDLDVDQALTKILSTRPVTFDWKPEHGGQSGIGFIAHELQEVAPECVLGEKDEVGVNDEIVPQAVDSSWLIPSICAVIKKRQETIDRLRNEIDLLKIKQS